MRAEIDRRAMAALSAGHFATDFAGGALPALLPFLKDKFSLSYTLVGVLILASQVSSSLIQPLFGLWSDRRGAMWLLPAGVVLAGVGIGLVADAPAYWLVVLFVLVQGLGTAAFHPEGSKFAAFVSGRRRASGMSLFSIGGNLGYGLGPLVITACIAWVGLRGAYVVAIPAVVVAAALVALRPYLGRFVPDADAHAAVAGEDRRGAMAVLLGVIACRNVAWFGLVTFVPLWEVSLGHSKSYGNHLLALMLLCGGIGTLVLGRAADRFGRRSVLVGSVLVTAPLILVFVAVGGVLGAVALGLVGACVVGTFGVTAVVAQEYLPRHVGMASGLTIGFALGLGGTAALVLGKVADATSLRTALYVCVVSPVLALAFAAFLPPTTTRRPLEPEVVLP